MPNTVLIGSQWGDEGKGKVIDFLTADTKWIVRYQGGNNAGHTIEIGDEKYVLHLIPSGVLRDDRHCVIGNGMVVDVLALIDELDGLVARGVSVEGRFWISTRAHIAFPYHGKMDAYREGTLSDGEKIGTTKRGIGPTYSDKINRTGLRMCDLLDPEFPVMLGARVEEKNRILQAFGEESIDADALAVQFKAAAERLRPYITDTIYLLNDAINQGESILFEGAQGTMLDIDFGTYPFVTSSSATAGGAATGSGVPPHQIHRVLGVIKAYTTRVGEGPFPTELNDEMGQALRKAGNEFGATTGRPRRCGWFDAVVARYSAMVNGINFWAMTKLDVLDDVDVIRVCTAYELDGKKIDQVPANIRELERCKPVYEDFPGWKTRTSDINSFEKLPVNAQHYVRTLEQITGVPVGILSVGPRRDSTIIMPGMETPEEAHA